MEPRRLALAFLCALPAAAPASAAPPPWIGTFHAVRPGADSMQDLTLTLSPGGKAKLVTRYPGYTRTAAGVPVRPQGEIGTWTRGQRGTVVVSFTNIGDFVDGLIEKARPDNTQYTFKLTGCVLAPAHRDPIARPPTFHKAGCS